ncbi:hypothetical protein [Bacillus atrophaeus]|nr:hypothetical protein [Bacillus atrophaeus]
MMPALKDGRESGIDSNEGFSLGIASISWANDDLPDRDATSWKY